MPVGSITRAIAVVLCYGAIYAVLSMQAASFDVASGVDVGGLLAGLNLAMAAIGGLAALPAILLFTVAGGILVGLPLPQLLLPSVLLTAGYGAAAYWLRHKWGKASSSALRFVRPLAAVALALPAVVNLLVAMGFAFTGRPGFAWGTVLSTTLGWWLRDAAGILTLAPLLIAVAGPYVPAWGDEPATGKGLLPPRQRGALLEFALELGGIALALYLAFFLLDANSYLYYVCLLPLLVVAWQHGLLRTTLAVALLNGGLFVAATGAEATEEITVFAIVLALIGLFLGALVADYRQRLGALMRAYENLEARTAEHGTALEEARRNLAVQRREREHVEASLRSSVEELQTRGEALNAAIEEHALLNDKLRASEEQLRELNARKDKFYSIVSHDVRNMLVSAIGFSKLLISDAETLPRTMIKEFASHVHSSTTNTYDLLENLLTWSHMQTGRMYYQRAWHGVDELIQNNITMLENNAAQKGIQLERRAADRDAQVYADRNMINSVLQNLISNAIKFTERGGQVTISAHTYESTVEIAVSDNGVGISPENVNKLFRIDQHVSTEGTEQEEGTGLGLVLCREMIEKNEGRIWVESEVGKGSTFRFTLPCAVEAGASADKEPSANNAVAKKNAPIKKDISAKNDAPASVG